MSLTLDYLERRVFYLLCACACAFLLLRVLSLVSGVETMSLDDPTFRESIEKVQPLLEIMLVGTLLISGVPKLFGFVKNNSVKSIVQYCCCFAGVALFILLIPEYAEASWGEQRLTTIAIVGGVMAAFFIISYWWGKRHTKKQEKEEEE